MNRSIPVLFLVMFFIGTDTFLIAPLLPTLQKEFQVPPELSGWMIGAYALGYALFALLAGPLSDRWNRKKVATYGMIAFAVTTMLCGFAFDFWSMIVARFLAGISAAFVSPQVWAMIPMIVAPDKIVRAMGIVTGGLAAAQILGVPLGSFLASSHWSYPFTFVGVLSLLLVTGIHKWIPDLPAHSGASRLSIVDRYRQVLSAPSSIQAFFAYFLFQMGNYAAFSFIGIFLTDSFRVDIVDLGTIMIVLGLGNLAGSLSGGHLVQKWGSYRLFRTSLTLLVAIFVVLPLSQHLVQVTGAFFLNFFMGGILFPIMMGSLQQIDPSSRGTISSLANSIMYGGTTVGSILAGFLYVNLSGFPSISLFTASCFLGSFLLFTSSRILQTPIAHRRQGEIKTDS